MINDYTSLKPFVYYVDAGITYILVLDGDTLEVQQKEEDYVTNQMKVFLMFGNRKKTITDLQEFKKDIKIWANEIKSSLGFDVIQYARNNLSMVFNFNNYFINNEWKTYKKSKPIPRVNAYEYNWIEKCRNVGMMYFNKQYMNKIVDCHGVDFSMFYPTMLCHPDLYIPITNGEQYKLKNIPKKFVYGIYNIIISGNDVIFPFNAKNTYTHFECNYALQLGLKMEFVVDIEFNAIKYRKAFQTQKIFSNIYTKTKKVRTQFPNNKLIKYISSQSWGMWTKCKYCTNHIDENDTTSTRIDIKDIEDKNIYHIKKLVVHQNREPTIYFVKKDDAYVYDYARIKPFLTGICKIYMRKLAELNKHKAPIIRIQCDNIVFASNTPIDITPIPETDEWWNNTIGKYIPIREEKTSGCINWKNINVYYHKHEDGNFYTNYGKKLIFIEY